MLTGCATGAGPLAPSPGGGDGTLGLDGGTDTTSGFVEPKETISPNLRVPDGATEVYFDSGVLTTDTSRDMVVGAIPSLPKSVKESFAGAKTASGAAPAIAYPTPGTMFPPNIGSILFQWAAPSGDVFRLHFATGKLTFDVYTDGTDVACTKAANGGKCWKSSRDDLMPYLGAASSLFGDPTTHNGTVELVISALDSKSPTGGVWSSPKYTLNVAGFNITGLIYYWSISGIDAPATSGIRVGSFDGSSPTDFITTAYFPATQKSLDAQFKCAACHTLSRDGKYLAASLYSSLAIFDVANATSPPPTVLLGPRWIPDRGTKPLDPSAGGAATGFPSVADTTPHDDARVDPYMNWASFSPDDSKLVVTPGGYNISNGLLQILDRKTGSQIGTNIALGPLAPLPGDTQGPATATATMPDWAPDGKHIVFAATPHGNGTNLNTAYYRELRGSSVAWISIDDTGTEYGPMEIIAPSTGQNCQPGNDRYTAGATDAFANPMFSPDSQWLAFSRGNCESELDSSSVILLAPAKPNAPLYALEALNTVVADFQSSTSSTKQVSNVTNSMPVWGHSNQPDPQNIVWIAFTSTRDYGFIFNANPSSHIAVGSTLPPYGVRQLWVAAIDLDKLENDPTADPSYPAFRFPGQDFLEQNHRPFWANDLLETFTKAPDILDIR